MGTHKGWRIRREPRSGRWRGAVRIGGGYRTRTFDDAAAARAWARQEAALVQVGTPSLAVLLPRGGDGTAVLTAGYIADLTARNRSPSHCRDALLILTGLAAACPQLQAADASERIERWLAHLESNGRGRGYAGPVSPARRNKYLTVVRGLCRWAMDRDRLERDPCRAIRTAAVPDYMKPQPTIDEARALARSDQGTAAWRWALLMLYAGLRSDEARLIRWGDIDWSGGALQIVLASGANIKRERERLVPIQPELELLLRPRAGGGGDAVCGLSPCNLRRHWAGVLTRAGIERSDLTPHSLRHAYAGMLTATGEPTALVGAYLGHSEASTTLGYVKLAARYVAGARGWPRGELHLLDGWACQRHDGPAQ